MTTSRLAETTLTKPPRSGYVPILLKLVFCPCQVLYLYIYSYIYLYTMYIYIYVIYTHVETNSKLKYGIAYTCILFTQNFIHYPNNNVLYAKKKKKLAGISLCTQLSYFFSHFRLEQFFSLSLTFMTLKHLRRL